MKDKKLTHETSAVFSILTVVIVLAIVGLVSQLFVHSRFDLTEDKQFTLSKAAVNTLENLPDLITIKAVISSDLPAQFLQIKTHVKDLLEEFRASSKGQLEVVFIDPGEDKDKKQQVKALGIQEVQMQEQSNQGMEIKKGFFGLAITYGDKKETIPVLNNLQTFEYDLVVKIKKLTGAVKKVAIIEGSEQNKYMFMVPGNPPQPQVGFDQNFPSLKAQMEKVYNLSYPDINSSDIADDIDMAIVAAPGRLSEAEIYRLDQFFMKGKSLLFMSPGVEVNLGAGLQGQATYNGYEGLMAHYGITVKKNIILEARNWQMVPFGNSIFPIPYPYWIVAHGEQLNRESAVTTKIGSLSFPWTSSINVDSSKIDSNQTAIILASSTNESWDETGRFNLYPRDLKEFLPVNQKSQSLIAMKTGIYSSFYKGKSLPADSIFTADASTFVSDSKGESRMFVVGSALFLTDFYMGLMRATDNLNFILNATDQLVLDPDLMAIRTRDISSRPISEDKKDSKLTIVTINMLVSPLILLIVGVFAVMRRRRRDAIK